jgi:transposase
MSRPCPKPSPAGKSTASRRAIPLPCDFALYCETNLVERFLDKLKHFRAIAAHYDMLARNFPAGVCLASAIVCSTEDRLENYLTDVEV